MSTPLDHARKLAEKVQDTNPLNLGETDLEYLQSLLPVTLPSIFEKITCVFKDGDTPYIIRQPIGKIQQDGKPFTTYHRDIVREDASFKVLLKQAIKDIGLKTVLESLLERDLTTYGIEWIIEFTHQISTEKISLDGTDNEGNPRFAHKQVRVGNTSTSKYDDTTFISGFKSSINTLVPSRHITEIMLIEKNEFERVDYSYIQGYTTPRKIYSDITFSLVSGVLSDSTSRPSEAPIHIYRGLHIFKDGRCFKGSKLVAEVQFDTREIITKQQWLGKSSLISLVGYLDKEVNLFTTLRNLDNRKGIPHAVSNHEDGTVTGNKVVAATFVKPKRTKQKISWGTDSRGPKFPPDSYPKVYRRDRKSYVLFSSQSEIIQIDLSSNTRMVLGVAIENQDNPELIQIVESKGILGTENHKRLLAYVGYRNHTYPIPPKRDRLSFSHDIGIAPTRISEGVIKLY
jgi:hypothetical protein